MASLVNQHKRMAMGEPIDGDNDFGVRPVGAGHKKHPDAGRKGGELPDNKRAIGLPVRVRPDQLPAQAAPDHGPMVY